MASKLTTEDYVEAVEYILKNRKQRKFAETIDLQIGLKDYDPKKDKRFSGTIKLPNVTRPNIKLCIIGDVKHCEEAQEAGIDFKSEEDLKKYKKDKKLIKKWAKQYDLLLVTDTLSRKVPKICGPILNKINMFPQVVTKKEPLKNKIQEIKCSVKFQLKKVICMQVPIGKDHLTEDEIRTNLTMSVNFLVSLLKKGWNNVKSLHVKTTMGKSKKLYG